MAGLKRGRRPSTAPLPQGTHVSHPPHSTKQKEKPPPPGATPTPTWAVHSVVFSSPMAQGATGGEVARQSQSLIWTVAVTRVCRSILGPTVCAICFSEVHIPTKATAQSETRPPIRN